MKTLKTFLTEIGNSRRPYRFTFHKVGDLAYGLFTTDAGIDYRMSALIMSNSYTLMIDFQADGDASLAVTDSGMSDAFRIMATMIEFTKRSIQAARSYDNKTITVVRFEANGTNKFGREDKKKDAQRQKLYVAFAKKELNVKKIKIRPHRVELTL